MSNDKFLTSIQDLEDKLEGKAKFWSDEIQKILKRLKSEDARKMINLQAESLSLKQKIQDEIREYSIKLSKDVSKKKELIKQRFEFYNLKYTIKTNSTEKTKLIEADLNLHERKLDVYETYINHLKEISYNLESVNYGIKNKLELLKELGID